MKIIGFEHKKDISVEKDANGAVKELIYNGEHHYLVYQDVGGEPIKKEVSKETYRNTVGEIQRKSKKCLGF